MAPKIEKLVDTENLQLGEAPHWDADTQSLYFVDIFGHTIHKYVPSTKRHTKANVGAYVSLIIPAEGRKDQFVVTLDREVALITWDGESEEVSIIEKLYAVDENTSNVFNDGKSDPSGRLWAGTMAQMKDGDIADKQGSLYSFQNKKVAKHATNIGVANGLAFDADRKKFYYIDSLQRTIDQYDFNIKNGTISNKKTIFNHTEGTLEDFNILDGMTIDTDGNLWVAAINLFKVLKIDPRKGTVVDSIQLPAEQITSVAFGGPNLDELYVTSGRIVLKGKEAPPAEGGVIYRVTGLKAKGLPGVKVVL